MSIIFIATSLIFYYLFSKMIITDIIAKKTTPVHKWLYMSFLLYNCVELYKFIFIKLLIFIFIYVFVPKYIIFRNGLYNLVKMSRTQIVLNGDPDMELIKNIDSKITYIENICGKIRDFIYGKLSKLHIINDPVFGKKCMCVVGMIDVFFIFIFDFAVCNVLIFISLLRLISPVNNICIELIEWKHICVKIYDLYTNNYTSMPTGTNVNQMIDMIGSVLETFKNEISDNENEASDVELDENVDDFILDTNFPHIYQEINKLIEDTKEPKISLKKKHT